MHAPEAPAEQPEQPAAAEQEKEQPAPEPAAEAEPAAEKTEEKAEEKPAEKSPERVKERERSRERSRYGWESCSSSSAVLCEDVSVNDSLGPFAPGNNMAFVAALHACQQDQTSLQLESAWHVC
jgi:outer membrane biosynthesis protein TonB